MKTKITYGKAWMTVVLLPVLIFLGGCSGATLDEPNGNVITRAAEKPVTLVTPDPAGGYEFGVEYRFTYKMKSNIVIGPGNSLPSDSIPNTTEPGDIIVGGNVAVTVSTSDGDYSIRRSGKSSYITFYKGAIYTVTASYIKDGIIHTDSKTIDLRITAQLETYNCIGPFMGTTVCSTRLKFSSNDGHEDNLFLPFDVFVKAQIINENPPPAFGGAWPSGQETIWFNQSGGVSMPEDYIYPLRYGLYSVYGNPEYNRITFTITQPSIR